MAVCVVLAGCGGLVELGAGDSGSEPPPAREDARADVGAPPRLDSGAVDAHVSDACVADAASPWRVSSGLHGYPFTGVWGSGPDDVWAAGANLEHWNGSVWSTSTLPGQDGGSYVLTSVWGSGPADAWVVGYEGFDAYPVILHWNGTAWSPSPLPFDGSSYSYSYGGYGYGYPRLTTVWGSGPNDVWAAGYQGSATSGAPMLHWDGSAWTESLNPWARNVYALWGSASDDVWATGLATNRTDAGSIDETSVILHWDGHAWTESFTWPLPSDVVYYPYSGYCHGGPCYGSWSYTNALAGLWGSGPRDVWAAGTQCYHPEGYGTPTGMPGCTPTMFHWDGTGWSGTVLSGGSVSGLWGNGACDVWAVGSDNHGGPLILHRDCSTWSRSSVPTRHNTALYSVWGSACAVWAVGDEILLR